MGIKKLENVKIRKCENVKVYFLHFICFPLR
jgi:hypothetical protein